MICQEAGESVRISRLLGVGGHCYPAKAAGAVGSLGSEGRASGGESGDGVVRYVRQAVRPRKFGVGTDGFRICQKSPTAAFYALVDAKHNCFPRFLGVRVQVAYSYRRRKCISIYPYRRVPPAICRAHG